MMSVLLAALFFGALIFVHELGHFLVAKRLNIKVEKFSIGFGPKILSFQRGETEYMLSWIPLGGYVKMLGENPGEDPEEEAQELTEEDKKRAYSAQPPSKRAMVLFAGSGANILSAYLIYLVFLWAGYPIIVPKLDKIQARVDEVVAGTPAQKAGILPGDLIIEIEGQEVHSWPDMAEKISRHPNRQITVVVERSGRAIPFELTPEAFGPDGEPLKANPPPSVAMQPDTADASGNAQAEAYGRIGIKKNDGSNPVHIIEAETFYMAPVKAAEGTFRMGYLVVDVVKKLFTREMSTRSVGGPLTIANESRKAASSGPLSYFWLFAAISINLGVINLFPVPLLDGGHLVFVGLEGIRKKPLKESVMINIQKLGFALIITLAVFVIYVDIKRFGDGFLKAIGGLVSMVTGN